MKEGDSVELLKVGCAGWWYVKIGKDLPDSFVTSNIESFFTIYTILIFILEKFLLVLLNHCNIFRIHFQLSTIISGNKKINKISSNYTGTAFYVFKIT